MKIIWKMELYENYQTVKWLHKIISILLYDIYLEQQWTHAHTHTWARTHTHTHTHNADIAPGVKNHSYSLQGQ